MIKWQNKIWTFFNSWKCTQQCLYNRNCIIKKQVFYFLMHCWSNPIFTIKYGILVDFKWLLMKKTEWDTMMTSENFKTTLHTPCKRDPNYYSVRLVKFWKLVTKQLKNLLSLLISENWSSWMVKKNMDFLHQLILYTSMSP